MSNPRAITRFQREAKVGAQLQHENLVRIYDEGEAAGIRYLVMEHIDGKNVAQLIGEQNAIPWPEAVRLARQIALGLEHAQQKGLIHRDVNPYNILVTQDGNAKLTDLGLAIDLADEANVTRDGATVGTFDYISPEQAKHSREVDTRADIYSLGCTLYHMIAGRVPFPMPSLPEKLYAHQLHEPDPLTSPSGDMPEALASVVGRMMRKRPEERYASPLAVAEALGPFVPDAGRSGSSASSSGFRQPPAPGSSGAAAPPAVAESTAPGAIAQAVAEASPLGTSASDPDLVLFALDTGPEAPLSASLSSGRPKPKAKPQPKPKAEPEPKPEPEPEPEPEVGARPSTVTRPRPRLRLSPRGKAAASVAAGVAVVVAAVVGISAVVAMGRKKLEDRPPEDAADIATANGQSRDPGKPPGPISVLEGGAYRIRPDRWPRPSRWRPAGGGGEVVLSGPSPIRLATTGEIRLPHGRVTIRADEGSAPVLAVDVVAGKPLLVTTPGTSIRLEGLRIIAHYQAMDVPTPLIEAGGSVALHRCIVAAVGGAGQALGVKAEGPKLAVDGCLLVGFDRVLDVTAFPGSETTVTQSILAPSIDLGRPPGWAIRVGFGGGQGEKPRKLTIDHATVRGGGLLEVVDFPASAPPRLVVSLAAAAVQGPSLVAWTPRQGEPAEGWTKGLKWAGKGNRYDVTGAAWVVASASGERPAPDAPRDLAAWSAAVGSDTDSAARSFRFAADPAAVAADLAAVEPGQFALEGEAVEGVGADPRRVGPVGGPAPKEPEPMKDEAPAEKAGPPKGDDPAKKAEPRP